MAKVFSNGSLAMYTEAFTNLISDKVTERCTGSMVQFIKACGLKAINNRTLVISCFFIISQNVLKASDFSDIGKIIGRKILTSC